jgi:hypothetical protein
MQLPELAGRLICNGLAIASGVQAIQVVVSHNPRIGPSLKGAAQHLAAKVPVIAVRNGRGLGFELVEAEHEAPMPAGG